MPSGPISSVGVPQSCRGPMPEPDLALDHPRLTRTRTGAIAVTSEPAIFRVSGPGAIGCVQGMLTNDVGKPGDDSLVYGAFLTPKGMIVVDAWLIRQADALTIIVPAEGHAAAAGVFQRQLPPRLARVTDLTGQARVVWLLGEHAHQILVRSGIGTPDSPGRVLSVGGDLSPVAVALAPEPAPFTGLMVGMAPAIETLAARLTSAGADAGDENDLRIAWLLAGWPTLGVEIDERTLPQEVRYDEVGGVSYTKGCYTGQETVARLHFRGHTNRELRGLRWQESGPLEGRAVLRGDKEVGAVRSTLALADRRIGLATIRREVDPGDTVMAGGIEARVVALPFRPGELEP
jgi:tRNA-modifying protein YgfZ